MGVEKLGGISGNEKAPQWIRPNLQGEIDEINRATREFLSQEPSEEKIRQVMDVLEASPLVDLSDEDWEVLDNTDSFHNVQPGHIEDAERITEEYNQELSAGNKRDFKHILDAFTQGGEIEAPTILRNKGVLHLVSGNTRLMIARGLNLRPKVVIGEIE